MKKINILFFLLLPFIDVVTALTTRFMSLPVSIGIIIKTLYIVVLSIYILFYSKGKYKKTYLYYLISVIIFSILYFVTKTDLINKTYLLNEVSNLFKAFYASVLFFGLLVLHTDNKLDKSTLNKLMYYSLIAYTLLLILPVITNTGFNSYGKERNNVGTIGWFYSGNDVSAIILMLYPFIYSFLSKYVDKNNKKTYLYYLLLIPVILSVFIIGTKTSWIGLLLITLVLMGINVFKNKNKKSLILVGVVLVALCLLTFISPTTKNIKNDANSVNTVTIECKRKDFNEFLKNDKLSDMIHSAMSGRENKAYTEILLYNDSSISNKLFGIGFTSTSRINDCNVEKYIEIDLLDIFVHYGIIGLIIVLMPFIYTVKYIIKNKIDIEKIKYIAVGLVMILISCIAGHIIGYPSSGIYLSIYLLLICMNDKKVEI